MFDKIFNRGKKSAGSRPERLLGRYSDNNKPLEKSEEWLRSEQLFMEKKYLPSFQALFNYLKDDLINNVNITAAENILHFELLQGSVKITGYVDTENFIAEAPVVMMPTLLVPAMRRMLEQNIYLNYCRYAIKGELVVIRLDSFVEMASPEKLFYALKEMANHADRQDDIFLNDFAQLLPVPLTPIREMSLTEKEQRFQFLKNFIRDTLDFIATQNQDLLAAGISYLLLALGYRIDFLITPQGILRHELETIVGIYYAKEEKTVFEKNNLMINAFRKWLDKNENEVFLCLYNTTSVFAIVSPQPHKAVTDVISATLQHVEWFITNKHNEIAQQILEYGLSHCQYSFSLPRPLTEIYQVFMQVNYSEYFSAIGFKEELYNREQNLFNKSAIRHKISAIIHRWSEKYPLMKWKSQHLRYDSLLNFNHSFLEEFQHLKT